MTIWQIARALLLVAEIAAAVPIVYLCVLAVSAMLAARRRERRPTADERAGVCPTFAVLVPAHDEEALVETVLASLCALDYPRTAYTVCLVADNCTDRTAELARAVESVRVLERHDPTRRGKGYALNWALHELEARQLHYDAYVIFDADSVVAPEFLAACAAELARGARAIQGCNTVLNALESPSTVLRWLALTLMNHVRPLGRNGLGASATLTGNGMCLSHALLARFPWEAFGVAEDYQYYLTLVAEGERVRYVPEAVVRSHMPTTFAQLQTQDIRWESGTPEMSKWRVGWRLLAGSLRARDAVRLEAVAELFTPPLSILAGWAVGMLPLALVLRSPLEIALAALLVAGLAGYTASALAITHAPRAVYRALLYAPAYMLWKLWVQLVLSRRKASAGQWVRTSRQDAQRALREIH
jgi:cellulose synthase/poly-beta-1,6-N-acetylglucosamine synthase-like glycosyltransferase